MKSDVFLSYRQAADSWKAERIYHLLTAADITVACDAAASCGHPPPGAEPAGGEESAVGDALLCLVVLNADWLLQLGQAGAAPDPAVGHITSALRSGRRLVPVLVSGARMPARHCLPAEIRPLTQYPPIIVRDDLFEAECRRLVGWVAELLRARGRQVGDLDVWLASQSGVSQLGGGPENAMLLGQLCDEALAVAMSIDDARDRMTALLQLAPQLSGSLRNTAVGHAFELSRGVGGLDVTPDQLCDVAELLDPPQRALALEQAYALLEQRNGGQDPIEKVENLFRICVLESVQRRAFVLNEFLFELGRLDTSFAARGNKLLTELAAEFDEPTRVSLMGEVLARARTLTLPGEQSLSLCYALPGLDEVRRRKAVNDVWGRFPLVRSEDCRAEVLAQLGPHLNPTQRAEALALIDAFVAPAHRLRAMQGYLTGLDPSRLHLLAEQVLRAGEQSQLLVPLAGFAPYLSRALVGELLGAALNANEEILCSVLKPLAGSLSPSEVESALQAVLACEAGGSRASGIQHLAAALNPEQQQRALRNVGAEPQEHCRVLGLSGLVPELAAEYLGQVHNTARALGSLVERARLLLVLLRRLCSRLETPALTAQFC